MLGWVKRQAESFVASYDTGELLLKTSPKGLVIPLFVALAFTLGPAYIEPVASFVQFRRPWIATLLAILAVGASLMFHLVRGAPPWGPLLTWLDTALYVSAIAWCVGSTAPPASHAYAMILGLMLSAGQSRDYSLSLPYALAFCLPAIGIVIALRAGLPDSLIVAFSCVFALWISQDTRAKRVLSRQNAGLRAALLTHEQVIDQSMDIALSSASVGIGHLMHELRNTHTAVSANLRYLAELDDLHSEVREVLAETLSEQERVQALVEREMASLRGRLKTKNEAFDVADVVRDAMRRTTLAHEVSEPARPFFDRGDSAHLAEVLQVLLHNAADAGATHVRLRCSIDASNQFATLQVEDDGPGLPKAALESLFRPFSTHGKKHGTGLGLYLARRRIELMGGSIRGANAEQRGAVFTLTIPGSVKAPPGQPDSPSDNQHAHS